MGGGGGRGCLFFVFSFLFVDLVSVGLLLCSHIFFSLLVLFLFDTSIQSVRINFVIMCMPGVCNYVHMHKN